MHFAQPIWIIAGILCCAALSLLLVRIDKTRQARVELFTGRQLAARLTRNVSPRLRLLKGCLLVLAVLSLFITLARPQYGYRWVDVKRKGIDILFALDTSRSMLAEDIKPNRLERARLGILDFISKLEGDRVGLMPFAGSPFLMTPLTLDYDAFRSSLKTIDTDTIPHGGTNIGDVIKEAERVLANDANHKILILMTDGENLQGDALEAARGAHAKGMTIYTVGVGTPVGELIPQKGNGAGFVKGEDGRYITSKLDESALQEIAEATDAMYTPLGTSGQGLEEIYGIKLSLIPKEELMEKRHKVPVDRFGWPLTAAIVLLLIEFLIPERKTSRRLSLPSIVTSGRRSKKTAALLLLLIPSITQQQAANAATGSQAFEAYSGEDYISASELYSELLSENPDSPKLHYNFGTSAYKNNMFDDAISSFNQALKGASLQLQEKAYFNRGNAYYKKGEETVQANPQETINQWQQAIGSFEGVLQLNSSNSLAEENRDFVRTKLEELQQKMAQEQQNNKDQQQDREDRNSEADNQNQQEQDSKESREMQSDDGQNSDEGKPDDEQQPPGQQPRPEQVKRQEQEQKSSQGSAEPQQKQSGDTAASDSGDQEIQQASRTAGKKMSREEAENLLNAMESDEQSLIFMPNFPRQENGRDW